jgi:predicted RND superfamily exporter protein
LSALVADAIGFGVLATIDIPVIRDLAVTAGIGVIVLIFTNLILLPVTLSIIGVNPAAAARSLRREQAALARTSLAGRVFAILERSTERRWATGILLACTALVAVGFAIGRDLKIGDLAAGAPELRTDSRYNRDNAYVNAHYGLSSDQFVVIVKTPPYGLSSHASMIEMDRLGRVLEIIPGVQAVQSAATLMRSQTAGAFEGNLKWMTIARDPSVLGAALAHVRLSNQELVNTNYSIASVVAYLSDHEAETLVAVSQASEKFAREHNTSNRSFLLAAGSSGVEAATNQTMRHVSNRILLLVYAAVALLCWISFQNWRAVLVALIPLATSSILCEALMVILGIGVKVSTLPVIALGVGIGVDYSLYLLSVQLSWQRAGVSLPEAYKMALHFTGKIVALVGMTLGTAVAAWAFSPIKFQADMGILLAFMFLWNMLGALILTPALSHFLLQSDSLRKRLPTLDQRHPDN